MKTMIATNRTHKTAGMMVILMMVFSMGYGQGMLIEGASKLFHALMQKQSDTEFTAINASFSTADEEENDSFRINLLLNVADRNQHDVQAGTVIASFNVKNIDVAYEAELVTESWMETSFTQEIETVPAVENWMTTSFSTNLESTVEVESWMTAPLANQLEEAVVTEEWMTNSFTNEIETAPAVENWMTTSFTNEIETAPAVEDWMTTPMHTSIENEVVAENWMTQPLR